MQKNWYTRTGEDWAFHSLPMGKEKHSLCEMYTLHTAPKIQNVHSPWPENSTFRNLCYWDIPHNIHQRKTTAVLFLISKDWKQAKYSSIGDLLKKGKLVYL